jgi:DNA polymerase III alpha subunit (gram-positive type)
MMQGDCYFSIDIETDGPIAGLHSMLAIGVSVAGHHDGNTFHTEPEPEPTFYRELAPIGEEWVEKALQVSGLDRDRLRKEGASANVAMSELSNWVRQQAGQERPVCVAFPLAFDWPFIRYYEAQFSDEPAFEFSAALDIKTMYLTKAGVSTELAGLTDLPDTLRVKPKRAHYALDDAIAQGRTFQHIMLWEPTTP